MDLASFRLRIKFPCNKICLPNVAEFARNHVFFGIIDEWILTNNQAFRLFFLANDQLTQ